MSNCVNTVSKKTLNVDFSPMGKENSRFLYFFHKWYLIQTWTQADQNLHFAYRPWSASQVYISYPILPTCKLRYRVSFFFHPSSKCRNLFTYPLLVISHLACAPFNQDLKIGFHPTSGSGQWIRPQRVTNAGDTWVRSVTSNRRVTVAEKRTKKTAVDKYWIETSAYVPFIWK